MSRSGLLGVVIGATAAVGVWTALPPAGYLARAVIEVRPDPADAAGVGLQHADVEDRLQSHAPADAGENLRLRWESDRTLAITAAGVDPERLRAELSARISGYLEEAVAEDAVARGERIKRLAAAKADLTRRVLRAEAAVRRIDLLAASLPTTASEPGPTLGEEEYSRLQSEVRTLQATRADLDARLREMERAQPPAPSLNQATREDDRVRRRVERLDQLRARLARTEEKVLATSPILAREVADVEAAAKAVDAALERYRAEFEGAARKGKRDELRKKLAETDAQLKAKSRTLAAQDAARQGTGGQLTSAASAKTVIEAEVRELQPLKEQRDAAARELAQFEKTPPEPRVRLLEDVQVRADLERKITLTAVAGMAAFVAVAFGTAVFGRR